MRGSTVGCQRLPKFPEILHFSGGGETQYRVSEISKISRNSIFLRGKGGVARSSVNDFQNFQEFFNSEGGGHHIEYQRLARLWTEETLSFVVLLVSTTNLTIGTKVLAKTKRVGG